MDTAKAGIREFRADLAEYIASGIPVALTRHGQTVGYFIPAQGQADADISALLDAHKDAFAREQCTLRHVADEGEPAHVTAVPTLFNISFNENGPVGCNPQEALAAAPVILTSCYF